MCDDGAAVRFAESMNCLFEVSKIVKPKAVVLTHESVDLSIRQFFNLQLHYAVMDDPRIQKRTLFNLLMPRRAGEFFMKLTSVQESDLLNSNFYCGEFCEK